VNNEFADYTHRLVDETCLLYWNLYDGMVAALIKLRDVCNALVLANSAENEILIGWPHLRGAREVWSVTTTNVCFRHAHVTATFLTIKLITHVFVDFLILHNHIVRGLFALWQNCNFNKNFIWYIYFLYTLILTHFY